MNERSGKWKFAIYLGLALGLLGTLPSVAATSDQELHELTWAHPNPVQVSRFIVFVSPVRGESASARQVEVGKPDSTSSGSFHFFSAIVPLDHEEFVAIGAVDNAGVLRSMSDWSAVPPSRPGQPLVVEP
jgi:hypothetical protein